MPTIKASFGMDINPLRAAARDAAAIGKKLQSTMQKSLSVSTAGLAKGITSGLGAAVIGVEYLHRQHACCPARRSPWGWSTPTASAAS